MFVRCDGDNCARVDPTVQTHYINRQFFDNLISYVPAKLLSGRQSQILDVMFTDYLYVVPSESLKYFPMWTIPAISPNESGSVSTGSKPMDGVIK